jgi:hypothetical protein
MDLSNFAGESCISWVCESLTAKLVFFLHDSNYCTARSVGRAECSRT